MVTSLSPVEDRPSPEETRPPLTWSGHAWRYVLCLVISSAGPFTLAYVLATGSATGSPAPMAAA